MPATRRLFSRSTRKKTPAEAGSGAASGAGAAGGAAASDEVDPLEGDDTPA